MKPELQRVEIEGVILRNHDLAVEDAAFRQLGANGLEQVREVAVEWLCVAALDKDFVAVAEDEGAEAVPLGLEDPFTFSGNSFTRLASIGNTGGLTARCTLLC